MQTKSRGYAIESESFGIVEEEMGDHGYNALEFPLVRRVIHATADFEVGKSLIFSEGAVLQGMEAIRKGSAVITDIHMVASGISRIGMERLGGGEVLCRIADPEVQKQADALGGDGIDYWLMHRMCEGNLEKRKRLQGLLKDACEQAKIRLSSEEHVEESVFDQESGTNLKLSLSRREFEIGRAHV